METQYEHNVTIEKRKTISATGVVAVNAFSAQQIALSLKDTKMYITGNDLKIAEFSKETGRFTAIGEIQGLKYSSLNTKLKLFK